ncbi:MAG: YncE family protein [Candidatus Nanopelagicales bacterium]|nr:YncE family protein [Candidatus Nanopelagicales bacterium]
MPRLDTRNADASLRIRRLAYAAPIVLGLAVLAGCSSSSSTTAPESTTPSVSGLTAYITNSEDNGSGKGMGSVIPVSLADQAPGTPIQMGEGTGPNDIVITADGKTAYVTNEYTGTVAGIDLATGVVSAPITVGAEPVALAFVPKTNEQWIWVANYQGQTITTVNVATGKVGQTIKVPNAGPNTVAFTPDGRTCFVANWGTDNVAGSTVTPIEVTDGGAGGRILPSIKVGLNPNWIAVTQDGSTAYVANKGSSSVTPIDVKTSKAGAALAVPGPPIELEIAPDGRLAYVAIAGSAPEMDEVVPLDLTTAPATVGQAIKLAPKSQPHWIAFTPDGKTAYVVGNGDSTLTPITVDGGVAQTPIVLTTDPAADLLAIALSPV